MERSDWCLVLRSDDIMHQNRFQYLCSHMYTRRENARSFEEIQSDCENTMNRAREERNEENTVPDSPGTSESRKGGTSFGSFSTSTPRSLTRDSGYVTDNSPASLPGQISHFSFDLSRRGRFPGASLQGAVGGSESDICEGGSPFEPILLEGNEDDDSAFRDSPFSPISPALDDSDLPEEDRLQVCRFGDNAFRHVDPAPPIPGPVLRCSMPIPVRMSRLRGFPPVYPPFISRSIGTQTPHEHCQLFERYLQTPLFLPLHGRGPVHRRLRHHSEGEEPRDGDGDHAPLPDIIPGPRDRSVSLPDFQTLRQQREVEMGRELRRISDEFNFSYRSSRRSLSVVNENFEGEGASFPGARPLRAVWSSLSSSVRSLLSFGSTDSRLDIEDPSGPS